MRVNMNAMRVMEDVCSLYDPFCPQARGARIPDGNNIPTLTYAVRQVLTATTDANGNYALVVTANPQFYAVGSATTNTSSVLTWNGWASNSFYNNISGTNCAAYRVVSFGVRIQATSAWTTATGTCIIGEDFDVYGTPPLYALGDPSAFGNSEIFAFRDLHADFIGKPVGMKARDFLTVSDSSFTFSNCVILLNGLPASTASATIEIVANYEYIPVSKSGYASSTLHPVVPHPAIMTLRDKAASTTNTIFQWTSEIARNKYVQGGVLGAIEGGLTGGPAGIASGAIKGVGGVIAHDAGMATYGALGSMVENRKKWHHRSQLAIEYD